MYFDCRSRIQYTYILVVQRQQDIVFALRNGQAKLKRLDRFGLVCF